MFSINYQKNHARQLLSLILATAMLTSLVAVTSYSATRSRSSGVAKANRATSLLTQPETPALKENGKIAFVSTRDGNAEIYLMNPDGSNQTNLTNNSADDYASAWSPDGGKIAFVSNRNGDPRFFVMNADGSNQVQLPINMYAYGRPSWSPDGTSIAFAATQNVPSYSDIFVANADGSHLTNLTNDPNKGELQPSWSPDGTRIVFIDDVVFGGDLYVMNADGSNPTKLTTEELILNPAWAPDSTEIALDEWSGGCLFFCGGLKFDIFVANATGGNPKQLTSSPDLSVSNYSPAWSPDGLKIAFERGSSNASTSTDIYVMNVDGSNQTSLTSSGNNSAPAWQPLPVVAPILNPLDDAQFFVRQHYRDFLNREPDPDGLAFWTNEITSCGSDAQCIEVKRINESAAFYLSIEFQQTGYLVYRIYKAAYANLPGAPVPITRNEFQPDTQEIGQGVVVNQIGWEQKLESNKQAFTAEFVQRSRFVSAYPNTMTPDVFVDTLFANTSVVPSSSDRAAAIGEFGSATMTADVAARARALRRVAENSTLAQQEFNRAFVLMQYFGYLRRNPNDAPDSNYGGYDFWLNKLDSFNGNFVNAEMVKAFIASTEYRQRFGP